MRHINIYLVANSHIDPVWLWDKYEGIDEVINTFRSACDRLDEYPELKFSASSICFYKWVEEYAPDVFERIRGHVQDGRWEITGGWWVETDCNLPSAESFYKSAEISKAYMDSRFGVNTPVAYSPDSFGHAATLPEILANSGFKYYIFCRPDENEKSGIPGNLFYWEYAGKRVLCYRLKYHYTQGISFDKRRVDEALSDVSFVKDGIASYFFGMGDHGGGPTKTEVEYLIKKKSDIKDRILRFSTCLEFFKEAEKIKGISTYTGDLHCHAIGCYSVNRTLKQAVRDAESALCYTHRVIETEGDANSEDLNPLWEKTIFNQFHDIMPGSCSHDAVKQALAELGGVYDACSYISYGKLKEISNEISVKCQQGEFRIFNSLPEAVTGPFEIESFMYFRPGAPFKDSSGRKIPIQEIIPSVNCVNRRWIFIDTIPARTMKSYYFDSEDAPPLKPDTSNFYIHGNKVSTAKFKIESPGDITDITSGVSIFKSPILFGVIKDQSDTWSHGIKGYGKTCGYFKEVSSSVCKGPLVSFLLSKQHFHNSFAELLFKVYETLPYIDLDIKVNWIERRCLLKLEIEPNFEFDSLLVQGPGGEIIKKTNRVEEPMHGWISAGQLGIIQDGAFAFDRYDNTLRLTLVRSSLYGYDKGWILDSFGPLEDTDLGEHKFRIRFIYQQGINSTIMDKLCAVFKEPFHVIRSNF